MSNEPKDTVSRLDPASNGVTTITVGKEPLLGPCCRVRQPVGAELRRQDDPRVRFEDVRGHGHDADRNRRVGEDRSWPARRASGSATDVKGTLACIDPATNTVVAEVYVPSGSRGIAFGEGGVWVTSTAHDSVTRVDPQTNLIVETIPVGKAPRFVAAGLGAVWTLNQGDGSVSRIDPKNQQGRRDDRGRRAGRRRRDRRRRRIGVGNGVCSRRCRGSIRRRTRSFSSFSARAADSCARRSRLGVAVGSARGKRVAPSTRSGSRRRCRIDRQPREPHHERDRALSVGRPFQGRQSRNPKDKVFHEICIHVQISWTVLLSPNRIERFMRRTPRPCTMLVPESKFADPWMPHPKLSRISNLDH